MAPFQTRLDCPHASISERCPKTASGRAVERAAWPFMDADFERWYAATSSRDPRFDGWVYVGVTSTGIYCRPSCPARTPKRTNVQFYPSAAGAQARGFRACRRCRPDTTPGSPEWDARADLVGRAMRLIADGIVDREGVDGLAARLGYSVRHVHRQLVAELGAGPVALARAQRAHTARILIETTELAFAHVAFAAGFASIRQFNDTIRAVFATTPTDLRARRSAGSTPGADRVTLRLAYRAPADLPGVLAHLSARAVSSVEDTGADGVYARSLTLPHGGGVVWLRPTQDHVQATLALDDLRDLTTAVHRSRRLLDLDADPVAVAERLGADPALRAFVDTRPGARVAGSVDPVETAVRAVLGQQVSIASARTLARRLVEHCGTPLARPQHPITLRFPEAAAIADCDLADVGLPTTRRRAVWALVGALERGEVDLGPGADRDTARQALQALPGVGPWTAEYIALRALGDPDAFPGTDLGLLHAAGALGLPATPAALHTRAEAWRPWRAYAAEHLWTHAARTPTRRPRAGPPAHPQRKVLG